MNLINKQVITTIATTLLKLANIVLLIAAVYTKQQYSFYTFLRWTIMSSFIFFAYKSIANKEYGICIFWASIAIIFNPIKQVRFQKDTWHLIDIIVATFLFLTILYDLLKNKQKS